MAGLGVDIEIRGLEDVRKRLDKTKLLVKPMKWLWGKIAFGLEREVKQRVPVDAGRLRASFGGGSYRGGAFAKGTGTMFDTSELPLFVKFGSNVQYAASLEYSRKSPRGVGQIPYFRPAIAAFGPKLKTLIGEAAEMIGKIWRE